jgi:hypothetical protein
MVRHGKFGTARELAVHPTTVEALRHFPRLRDRLAPVTATSALFMSAAGLDCSAATSTTRLTASCADPRR